MNQGWMRACILGLCLALVSVSVWGQSVAQPEAEYRKLIRVDQAIHPLGAHPFGEHIGLYNGHLSFEVTDVSARGNGPTLNFTRSFKLKGPQATAASVEQVMGYWAIELPRIQTLVTQGAYIGTGTSWQKVSGWVVGNSGSSMRCQSFGPPPMDEFTNITSSSGAIDWGSGQWWQGYHLIIPGQGSKDILQNLDSSTNATYPAVTKNHWRLSCISETTTANGQPGDGFIAWAPDGTSYYLISPLPQP